MSAQVFGCPKCNQPFQVLPQQAGQVVQCPSCTSPVEIPESAFSPVPPPPTNEQVFACGHCQGQFAVTSEMAGMQVACPHCQQPVQIPPNEASQSVEDDPPEVPVIDLKTQPSRKGKRKTSEDPPDKTGSHEADLFAPGFKQPKTEDAATDQLQPRRRQKPTSTPADASTASTKQTQPGQTPSRPGRESSRPAESGKLATSKASPKKSEAGGAEKPDLQTEARPGPLADTDMKQSPAQEIKQKQATGDTGSDPSRPFANDSADTRSPNSEFDATDSDSALANPPDQIVAAVEAESPTPDPIDHLLPPRFDLDDPTRIRMRDPADHRVFLPDGKGGTKQVDQRIVRIKHNGEMIPLVALTPKQKRQRRIITNLVAILISIAILALAFWILSL